TTADLSVITVKPTTLEARGIRLEPLELAHTEALIDASGDGKLWELWYTAVPVPEKMARYIEDALAGQATGTMLPWGVRDASNGTVIGTTRYHDIVAPIDRVEIGYTWYSESRQGTAVNRTCKLML